MNQSRFAGRVALLCWLVLALGMAARAAPPAPAAGLIVLDLKTTADTFEGIGALSAGASSRLLIDYPEPQRSQVLDYLFKPKYGAALQHLKVEIGGDVDSTDGTEPSIARTREEFLHPKPEYFQRGYEWWLMREAKKRNPRIVFDILQWGAPGWIGKGQFYSHDNADFIAAFILGAKKYHDLDISYCGVWNEKPYNTAWIKRLRRTLDRSGLKQVKIVAADEINKWTIADRMAEDPELCVAVEVIGTHYPHFQSTPTARGLGKPVWANEDGPWTGNWAGAPQCAGLPQAFNRNYVLGRMTKAIVWSPVTAYYNILPLPGSGLMRANEPWSGHYDVQPAVWITAHTTQFIEPGWKYLGGSACGMLPGGGSRVAAVSPDGKDLSVVVETIAAKQPQTLVFKLVGGKCDRLHAWRSTPREQFVPMADIPVADGGFSLTAEPDAIYSLTTTSGQQKAVCEIPPSRPLPLPYRDDFESYAVNATPRYLSDFFGAFEVKPSPRGGKCLQQVIRERGIEWCGDGEPATVIGSTAWRDYEVSCDVCFDFQQSACLYGRIKSVPHGKQPPQGYVLRIARDGAWTLDENRSGIHLASGKCAVAPSSWHRLGLRMIGKQITAFIDGWDIGSAVSETFPGGLAGLGCGREAVKFEKFAVEETTHTSPATDREGAGNSGPAALVDEVADTDAVMRMMETPVKPETLAAFKKAHPASLWLFGEDRQRAVRKNIIPAHWFENNLQAWNKFSGVARPGEFYMFQVCVVCGEQPIIMLVPQIEFLDLPGVEIHRVRRTISLRPGEVQSYWFGINVSENAQPRTHHGKLKVGEYDYWFRWDKGQNYPPRTADDAALNLNLKIAGEPIAECGTAEAWRLARLKWLDSTVGESETDVTRPFTPVRVDEKARTVDILGRRITIGPSGIPSQYTSFFSGSNTKILATGADAFASPPRLECIVDGKAIPWKTTELRIDEPTPVGAFWSSCSKAGDLTLGVASVLKFDGNQSLEMQLHAAKPVTIDDVRFVVPWAKGRVKYAMGLGLKGGVCPVRHDWKWDVSKNQDAIWLGDVNQGLMLRFKDADYNYRRPLVNAYYDFQPLILPNSWGGGGIKIENQAGHVTLTANSGRLKFSSNHSYYVFNIDWYFTPFKPINTRQHFVDRFYHAGQGAPLEDPAALHAQGVNIIEVHHNRLCNPYINYPYNDDSLANLTAFVKKAHAASVRVNLYYTTRELTQNLPEFFALKSLDGEVILPRRPGVPWPVTNRGGPHPWLKEHVGLDIVPAWRENLHYPGYRSKLDLAVITTPDSRWNNFYLAGLDYLIRKAGIDGLYIDDTALDRKSMLRARRILDADGNPGRRVSMHSWNHFNGLAKWTNSSIAFMELYPYYDGLWHGEGFSANSPPEYMLVEMSGIPFGLMSEMLNGPNPWHGLVFGMRTRWPWSGDPRPIWKAEDAFGIADAELIGWWDNACPVQTGNAEIKATVYKRQGRAAIALASWAKKPVETRLVIDWKSLGLDPAKIRLTAAEIAGFQPAAAFSPGDAIPIAPGKGWLLVAGPEGR